MYNYYNRKPIRADCQLPGKRSRTTVTEDPGTSLPTNPTGQKAKFPLQNTKNRVMENEQDMPFTYYVIGGGRAIGRWYKDIPLFARIVIALFTLFTLTICVNVLIQLIISSMSLIYTVLGILTSVIVIYEFLFKRQRH